MSDNLKVYGVKAINNDTKRNNRNSRKQENNSESSFSDSLKEKLDERDRNQKFRQSMKLTEELEEVKNDDGTNPIVKGRIYDRTI